jgi:hypothetical protein
MRVIELNAANWKTVGDFYAALLPELGAPEWHGDSVNALVDSMIWGEINQIDPPYRIIVRNVRDLPRDVANELNWAKHGLAKGRADFQARKNYDVVVEFEILD